MWGWGSQMSGSLKAEPDLGISWECTWRKRNLLRKWREQDRAGEDSQARGWSRLEPALGWSHRESSCPFLVGHQREASYPTTGGSVSAKSGSPEGPGWGGPTAAGGLVLQPGDRNVGRPSQARPQAGRAKGARYGSRAFWFLSNFQTRKVWAEWSPSLNTRQWSVPAQRGAKQRFLQHEQSHLQYKETTHTLIWVHICLYAIETQELLVLQMSSSLSYLSVLPWATCFLWYCHGVLVLESSPRVAHTHWTFYSKGRASLSSQPHPGAWGLPSCQLSQTLCPSRRISSPWARKKVPPQHFSQFLVRSTWQPFGVTISGSTRCPDAPQSRPPPSLPLQTASSRCPRPSFPPGHTTPPHVPGSPAMTFRDCGLCCRLRALTQEHCVARVVL